MCFTIHLHMLTRIIIHSSLWIHCQYSNLRLLVLYALILLYHLFLEAPNSQEQQQSNKDNCEDYKEDYLCQHGLIYP